MTGPLIIDSVWLLSLTWERSRGTRSQSPLALKKLGWWSQTARNPPSHGRARSRREELVQHGLSAAESQKKQASNTHIDNEWEVWEQKSEGKKKRLHLLCHYTAMKACKMSSCAQNWWKCYKGAKCSLFSVFLFIHIKSNQWCSAISHNSAIQDATSRGQWLPGETWAACIVELMSIGPAGDEQVNSTNRQTELPTAGRGWEKLSRFHKVSRKVFSCFWMSALLWRKSNYCVTTSLKILQIWTFRWFYFMTATEKRTGTEKKGRGKEWKQN